MFYTMLDLCEDLVEEALFWDMADGEGAGPRDQAICSEIAERFETNLAANPDGLYVVIEPSGGTEATASIETYRADREVVLRWIEFLRHCGGFEVWR